MNILGVSRMAPPLTLKNALLATSAASAVMLAYANAAQPNNGPQAPINFRTDYFGYGLAVGPSVTYTDNIFLSPNGFKTSDEAISVNSNGTAIYTTNSFSGILDGSLDASYLAEQGKFVLNQDVGAVGTATLKDNLLYIDVAGSSTRQLAGANARFSRNINAGRNQRINVSNASVSPYLNHRFTDGSAAELRYRVSQVFIGQNANLGANFNRDSRTQEAAASYNSGTAFGRLQVTLNGYGNKTREYGNATAPDFEFKQGSFSTDIQYALTNSFALSGTVGYDKVDTTAPFGAFTGAQLTGLNWRAGFRAQPGRRTDILLQYGRRYDRDYVNANIRYDLTNRITFAASAGQKFQTRAQATSTQFDALQRRTLDFVEALRTSGGGLPASQIVNSLTRVNRIGFRGQVIGFGLSRNAAARLGANFGRTNVGITGAYNDIDYSFRRVKYFGGGISLTHDLSRRMSVFSDFSYRRIDSRINFSSCIADPTLFGIDTTIPGFDATLACNISVANEGVTDTVGGRIGVSYRVYQNVSAYGQYSYSRRFAQNPGQEYSENTAVVGVQLEF